jgi:hypothetical protein
MQKRKKKSVKNLSSVCTTCVSRKSPRMNEDTKNTEGFNYDKDLVKAYIEVKAGSNSDKKWEAFGWLLSNPVLASQLEKK